MLQQQPSGAMACSRKLGLDLNRHAPDLDLDLDLERSSSDGYQHLIQGFVGAAAGGDGAGESRSGEGTSSSSPLSSDDGPIHGMYANPLNLHHHHHRRRRRRRLHHRHRHRHRQELLPQEQQEHHGFASSSLPSPCLSQLLPPPPPRMPPSPVQHAHPFLRPMAIAAAARFWQRAGEGEDCGSSISPEVFQQDLGFQPTMEAGFLQQHQRLPHQIFGLHSIAPAAAMNGFLASSPIPPSPPHPSPTPHFAPLNQVKIEREEEEEEQEQEQEEEQGIDAAIATVSPSICSASPAPDALNAQWMRSSSSVVSQQLPHSPSHMPAFERSNHVVKIEEEDGARHGAENGCGGAIAPAPSSTPSACADRDFPNALIGQRMRSGSSIVSQQLPHSPSHMPAFERSNNVVKIEEEDGARHGAENGCGAIAPSACPDQDLLNAQRMRPSGSIVSQQLPQHSPSHMPTFKRSNNFVKIEKEDGARHGGDDVCGAIAPSACPDQDLLNAQRMRSNGSIVSQQPPHSPSHMPTFKRSNNFVKIENEDGARHGGDDVFGAIAPSACPDLDLLNAQRMRPSGSIVSQQLPHSAPDFSTFERSNYFVKIEKEEGARYSGDDVFGDGDDDTRSSLPAMDSETPSTSAGDVIITKFTVESPAWLPDGWVTEVQTRQTGTSAGTKDKYFKDLISGRRFRSRNEVLHFLKTGKGRPQKRQKKVIRSIDGASTETATMSAATVGSDFNQRLKCTEASPYMPPCQQGTDFVADPTMNANPCQQTTDLLANSTTKTNLDYVSLPQSNPAPESATVTDEILSPPSMDAHPSHVSFPQPQPAHISVPVTEEISVSSSMNTLPSHVSYVQPQPAAMAAPVTEQLPSSSSLKQVAVLPTSTTAEPPISPITWKRISPQQSPQKLLSKKKSKMISSPNDAVNKQASRLWQWLQKPAPNEPQVSAVDSNAENLVTQLPAGLERSMEGLEREIHAAQRTVHLGSDLLSAQKTVMKLGREMQASVERLSRGIQAVQRTANTRIESAFSDDFELETEFRSNQRPNEAMCNAVQAAKTIDSAMEEVMQAAERINDAMESIIRASQKLDVATGNVIQAPQVSETSMNTTPQIGEMSNNASQRFDSSTSTCNEFHIPPSSHDSEKKTLFPIIENGIHGTPMPNLELPFCIQGLPMVAMGNGFYISEGPNLVINKVYPSTETRTSFIPVHVMGNGVKTELLPVVAVGIVDTHIQPMPQMTPVPNPVIIQPPFQVPLVNSMSYQIPNNNMSALVDDKHMNTPIKTEDVA